ncbi:hypothetical protein L6164_024225 [Bauhinia variegata]|uniref:Uncharacterized protein n=1 Tax=Bauhinia variegata TaxID=167791 RepID=A0ACB9LY29_BAUVA|nr:hypothetical protein L6164_024225 [Bauhinia variegata]
MASNPRSRQLSEPRSGGKIVRPRRTQSSKTPYERPQPSNSTSKSPNWFSRFVSLPARFVATGTGKLLSAAINLESSSTSSSETNSSSESSYSSDSSAEVGNSKSKQLIVQLLLQETFSRDECDQLIKIIRSRVADSPTDEDGGEKRPSEISNRTCGDVNTPDICSAAVIEAKKWLKEKKLGLDSKSDLGQGSHSSNLVTLPQAYEHEGSPVDVAKSYMRQLPPWASPSIDHAEPSKSFGIQLFKEETPYRIIDNSTSSSKLKRDSPATGSWSIQDEIRRVRSRATEEMLRTRPSSKIDWSAIAVEHTYNANSSATENIEATTGEKLHSSTNSIDAPLNLAKGLSTQASQDFERKHGGLQTETVLTDPANFNSDQNKSLGATQQTEDDCRQISVIGDQLKSSDDIPTRVHSDDGLVKVNGIDNSNGVNHQLNSIEETREVSNSRLRDGTSLVFKEKVRAEDAMANGFSGPSSSAGQAIEQNTKTLNNVHSTHHERVAKDVIEKEASEASLEVPANSAAINEDDGVATGSQNSSSMQYEDHSQSQPTSEPNLTTTKTNVVAEKQKSKRITRYNRRGTGRGVK